MALSDLFSVANPAGVLGGAVSDLFGGVAGLSEAGAYQKAATIAGQNVGLEQTSTALQETALARQAYQTISASKASVAGAGFAAGGSAGDILRSSAQQAALAKGITGVQGAITEAGFAQQAAAYSGQAAAAKTKGAGGIFGGLLQGGLAIGSLLGL